MPRTQQLARPDSSRARLAFIQGLKVLGLAGLTILLALSGAWLGALHAVKDQPGSRAGNAARRLVAEIVSPEYIFGGRSRINVLLIGEDITLTNQRQIVDEPGRSDTNILISLDRLRNAASAMSFPRDTRVEIPGQGVHKLNAAHKYGGPFLLIQTLHDNFSVRVDHYIRTDFRGFVEIVDLVGGVDVEVERDMDYDDSWQDFHVHLKQGLQHLDGQQAHGYIRWRKNNPRSKGGDGKVDPKGDLGRIERQQKVIKILAKKLLSPSNLPKLRQVARAFRKFVETDLTDRQLVSMVLFITRLNPDAIETATIDAHYSKPFMVVDRDAAALTMQNIFGPTFDSLAFLGHESAAATDNQDVLPEPVPSRIRELEEGPDWGALTETDASEPAQPEMPNGLATDEDNAADEPAAVTPPLPLTEPSPRPAAPTLTEPRPAPDAPIPWPQPAPAPAPVTPPSSPEIKPAPSPVGPPGTPLAVPTPPAGE